MKFENNHCLKVNLCWCCFCVLVRFPFHLVRPLSCQTEICSSTILTIVIRFITDYTRSTSDQLIISISKQPVCSSRLARAASVRHHIMMITEESSKRINTNACRSMIGNRRMTKATTIIDMDVIVKNIDVAWVLKSKAVIITKRKLPNLEQRGIKEKDIGRTIFSTICSATVLLSVHIII